MAGSSQEIKFRKLIKNTNPTFAEGTESHDALQSLVNIGFEAGFAI